MLEKEADAKKELYLSFGVAVWVSFLLAAVATMLFFATFDPVAIGEIATFSMRLDPMSGYSMGFLLFWLLLMINSMLAIWLIKRPTK